MAHQESHEKSKDKKQPKKGKTETAPEAEAKDSKKKGKHGPPVSTSTPPDTGYTDKKDKRSLRFILPEKEPSVEEYESALSILDDEEEVLNSNQPFLRKFLLTPLKHSRPRPVSPKPCFSTLSSHFIFQHEPMFISPASSSKQLFEVLRNSPTPSDADINMLNSVFFGRVDEVKEFIENGADVNTFRDRQTPLIIATEAGDLQMVQYLLSVPKVNVNFQNVFGQTPLSIAVRNSLEGIAALLLNHKAKVNIADNLGRTPLHDALFKKRPKLAKLLLAYGADCNQEDCFGERPIYTSAVKKPNLECLNLLIKVGASLEYTNYTGISLLSRSILNWTPFEIIETLVARGAGVNSPDINSWKTPLHFAAMINDVDIAKLLVDEGAHVNVKSSYNFTPFQEAIFHRSVDVAEYLVPFTENVNLKFLTTLKHLKGK